MTSQDNSRGFKTKVKLLSEPAFKDIPKHCFPFVITLYLVFRFCKMT